MAWTMPTASPYVTSRYNPARWLSGRLWPHYGTDYRAPTGTPIYAIADGQVTVRGYYPGGAGHYIRIQHANGTWSGYSHLSRKDVAKGERVEAGQRIGLAGSTGIVTGAHLHLGIKVGGRWVDPHAFLTARGARLPQSGSTPKPPPAPTPKPEPKPEPEPEDEMTPAQMKELKAHIDQQIDAAIISNQLRTRAELERAFTPRAEQTGTYGGLSREQLNNWFGGNIINWLGDLRVVQAIRNIFTQ